MSNFGFSLRMPTNLVPILPNLLRSYRVPFRRQHLHR
jgi:hypothetical protein